jgi:hypothetical protein
LIRRLLFLGEVGLGLGNQLADCLELANDFEIAFCLELVEGLIVGLGGF